MCVRWSSDGRYLASGSDDKIVMIWSIEQSVAQPNKPLHIKLQMLTHLDKSAGDGVARCGALPRPMSRTGRRSNDWWGTTLVRSSLPSP